MEYVNTKSPITAEEWLAIAAFTTLDPDFWISPEGDRWPTACLAVKRGATLVGRYFTDEGVVRLLFRKLLDELGYESVTQYKYHCLHLPDIVIGRIQAKMLEAYRVLHQPLVEVMR